jgi:hypothetical protein
MTEPLIAGLVVVVLTLLIAAFRLWRKVKKGPCHTSYKQVDHPDFVQGMAYCKKCGAYFRTKPQMSASALKRTFGN